MNVFAKAAQSWLENEGAVGEYREGLYLLKRSGILNLIRLIGTPSIINQGESQSVMAGQAHWANGYQSCIDHLLYFETLFGKLVSPEALGPPDFGGTEAAIKRGDLRKEDL